jgi:hypothetical protein
MREEATKIAGLVLSQAGKRGRVAFMPADVDRRFARENLPDHGNLLANIVRWAASDTIPLSVEGAGLIDCHLYSQPGRVILHMINLVSAGTWRAPIDEYIPVGPFKVKVKLPEGVQGRRIRFLAADRELRVKSSSGWAEFEIPSLLDHEVIVIG